MHLTWIPSPSVVASGKVVATVQSGPSSGARASATCAQGSAASSTSANFQPPADATSAGGFPSSKGTVATLVPQAHPAQKQILELLHPLELHATRQREFLFSPSLSPAGQNVTRAQLAAAVADGWVVSNAGVWTSAGMVRVLRRGDVETFVIVEE